MATSHWLWVVAALAYPSVVCGQGAYTPAPGSEERQAILDAVRVKVSSDLSYSGPLLFRVDDLNVYKGWAFFNGQPVTGGSNPIQKKCIGSDALTIVLLRFDDGGWHVERGGVACATDAFWLQWQKELGAPNEIFQLKDK